MEKGGRACTIPSPPCSCSVAFSAGAYGDDPAEGEPRSTDPLAEVRHEAPWADVAQMPPPASLPLTGPDGKQEVEFAKARLDDLRAGRLDQLEAHLDPSTQKSGTRTELERMTRYYPAGEPRSLVLIGSNVWRGPGWWNANLSFQYEFPDAWMVANVVLARKDGSDLVVKGMHVERIPDSLQHINAFTFAGKGSRHYLIVVAALLMVVLEVASFVVCIRTRGIRKRWLWAVFTLLGVVGVTLNWTTGAIGFQLVSVHLLGAGAAASSPYSPWIVTVSFPLGALVFLANRKRLSSAGAGDTTRPSEITEPDPQ